MEATISPTVHVDVHYLTRVEGHGHIVVDMNEGTIERCELQIVEAPRYFEAMLRGLPASQATLLASRICGICAVTHATASIRAVEAALDIQVSPQTTLLRQLALCGELLDSHILHTLMLVAPDLVGMPSAIALAAHQPELVRRALRMKQIAGDLCTAVAGRHTHPIAMTPGGFTHFPTAPEIAALRERLLTMRADMAEVLALWRQLALPPFERAASCLALTSESDYGLMGYEIASSLGGRWPVPAYRQVVEEFQVAHSTAKHARHREPYMVGALARFKLNHERLHPRALGAAESLGLWPDCANPYLNTLAQVVEIVHAQEMAIELIDELLDRGIAWEPLAEPGRPGGSGVGAVEAPRGSLYHEYTIVDGLVTEANCVIPTGQNLANIEADMRALLPQIRERTPEEITLAMEMLVRAYDPCISCATHMLEVEFV